ncbi:MAG: phosphatidate cytidylyltransferase [Bacteroidetes bacterium]|nr:phosphatidate cytidylyltransferase [Bacteroidota bacterium]
MNTQTTHFLLLSGGFLLLFGICEYLYHVRKWQVENTRKVAHAGSGLLALSFPFILEDYRLVFLICGAFLLILVVTKYTKLLRSIHAVARVTYGSSMFPIVVSICFWFYSRDHDLIKFYLPILVMALADPAACLFGRRFPMMKLYKKKTLGGSLVFFATAFCLGVFCFNAFQTGAGVELWIFKCALLALCTTLAEALSQKGSDNLTIPLSALGVLVWF